MDILTTCGAANLGATKALDLKVERKAEEIICEKMIENGVWKRYTKFLLGIVRRCRVRTEMNCWNSASKWGQQRRNCVTGQNSRGVCIYGNIGLFSVGESGVCGTFYGSHHSNTLSCRSIAANRIRAIRSRRCGARVPWRRREELGCEKLVIHIEEVVHMIQRSEF